MKEITPLDEAQLKHEMRDLFKREGYYTSVQALYEIIIAGRILAEVIQEELKAENDSK